MAKRDHIAAILAMPDVASAWRAAHGRQSGSVDIDAMYEEFLPLQRQILKEHSEVIPGVPEAVAACRRMGLKIGSTTGYTRALMEIVSAAAQQQGYEPDCVLCAEDAPRGRPAPYLLYQAAMRLDAYPLWSTIAVDDTPVGIAAGRNAGCWTVGVTRTGNCVGLSREELAALSPGEARRLCDQAARRLESAGAHYTVESAADIVQVVGDIERRLQAGESPVSTTTV
jgi:phosphonoacetaldehyde hydrolase